MSDSLLLRMVDLVFRAIASEFSIDNETPPRVAPKEPPPRYLPHDLPATLLKKYEPEGVVTVLKEFSFPETLNLMKSLNREARGFILESIQEHRDLKAALEFGLQYEEEDAANGPSEKTRNESEQIEICSLFIKRLSEWSGAKNLQRKKVVSA